MTEKQRVKVGAVKLTSATTAQVSVAAVARHCNVSSETVRRWRDGRAVPTAENIKRLREVVPETTFEDWVTDTDQVAASADDSGSKLAPSDQDD